MGNQNKRTVDIGQTNQIAEWRESNNAWSATSFLSKNKTRSVNEPRSSGSLRISDMTLMGLCPLLALSGHPSWADECPLSGVKRTSKFKSVTSAFDPSATWAILFCCDAQTTHRFRTGADFDARRAERGRAVRRGAATPKCQLTWVMRKDRERGKLALAEGLSRLGRSENV